MPEKITRRSFIAAAAAPALLRAQGTKEKIQVGWIGVGVRGYGLIGSLMEVAADTAHVKAVCDTFAGNLARGKDRVESAQKTAPDTYSDYRRMLDDKSIDAVFVMTPGHLHRDMVVAALDAGKHVYVEKPLSYTIDEGLDILKAVQRSGRKVQVGTQRRSSLLYQRARQIYESGALGKVTFVRAFWYRNSLRDNPQWRYPISPDASEENTDFGKFLGNAPKQPFNLDRYFRWRLYWDYSAGIITELMVHQTDVAHMILGARAPKSVVAQGGLLYWTENNWETPDTFSAVFEYPEFQLNWSCTNSNKHYGYGEQFLGSEATMEIMNMQDLHVYNETFGPQTPAHIKARAEIHLNANRDLKQPNPNGEHVKNFIEAIRDNKPLACDALAGHEGAVTGHLATLAYRRDKKVFWDAATQKYRLS